MKTAMITGAAGLIGAEAARFFAEKGFRIIGIDNDLRKYFFGDAASTAWSKAQLQQEIRHYKHCDLDIRDVVGLEKIFSEYGSDVEVIIHAAAQPSHDWAAKEPFTDFS